MNSSAKDYEILYKLIMSAQNNFANTRYFEYEIIKALLEIVLNAPDATQNRLLKLTGLGMNSPYGKNLTTTSAE